VTDRGNREFDKGELRSLLMRGASGVYLHEASIVLLARHGYWLVKDEFLRFVVPYDDPPVAAGIDWTAAMAALDSGDLRADEEDAAILRIASSIAGRSPVILFDVLQGIDRDNIRYVAEAVMYADGFLESVADPRP
jgi:hypothetical protein